jgi:uncharacterized protein (TIGR02246 family)
MSHAVGQPDVRCGPSEEGAELNPSEIAASLSAGFVEAWNQHDMEALAHLFHEDAAFVNVRGGYLKGREEIQVQHQAIHAGPYKDSVLAMRVLDALEVAPGAIVVHAETDLEGDSRLGGETSHSIVTFIIDQRGEHWAFAAAHNTLKATAS